MLDSLHILLITLIVGMIAHQLRENKNASDDDNDEHSPTTKKAPTPTAENLLPPAQFLDFLLIAGKTKQEKRTGWVNNDIPGAESIADHMYRMALMALFIRDGSINNYQAAHVAMLHDFSESLVGDITPPESSGISVEDKHQRELQAVEEISKTLVTPADGGSALGAEFRDLYDQYNNQTTAEGRFCKQLDKLEMVIQAFEYEQLHPEKDLTVFYNSGRKGIKHPYLLKLQEEVLRRREEMLAKRQKA